MSHVSIIVNIKAALIEMVGEVVPAVILTELVIMKTLRLCHTSLIRKQSYPFSQCKENGCKILFTKVSYSHKIILLQLALHLGLMH